LNVFFWNIGNKSCIKHVVRATQCYDIDILILAECDSEIARKGIGKILNKHGFTVNSTPGCDKLFIITKKSIQFSLFKQDTHFSTFCANKIIFCAVHFPSKLHATVDRQRRLSERACQAIEETELRCQHMNSVMVGDFNMNPFDEPMISFTGIKSTNHSTIGQRAYTRDDESAFLFYNPTWTLYGKYQMSPGTYKYSNLGHNVLSWHLIDQVIIRPSLIQSFDFDRFAIVQTIGRYSLCTNAGKPKVSDHLPICFTLI
jgi:hypothetical protein